MTATARKAAPRKAAPRKAAPRKAKAQTSGHVNGHTAEVAPPEQVAIPPLPDHPYGSVAVYTYASPSDGGPAIVFPHVTEVNSFPVFWKARKFKMSPMDMTFEWMDAAKVPDSLQERVANLPPTERNEFFKGWFAGAIEPPEVLPGES